MKCPSCGYKNIPGSDECDSCHQNLASLDGVASTTKAENVLMSDPLFKVAPRDPAIVDQSTSILEAVKKMNAARVGCVLVVNAGILVGIVSERDVVMKAIGSGRPLSEMTVSSIMTPNPDSLSSDDTLALAINRMSVGGFRHIPITKNGRPIGIVSIRDLLRHLSKLFP